MYYLLRIYSHNHGFMQFGKYITFTHLCFINPYSDAYILMFISKWQNISNFTINK